MAISNSETYAINVTVDDDFVTATNTAQTLTLDKAQYRAILTAALENGFIGEVKDALELERVGLSNYNNLIAFRDMLVEQSAPASVITTAERAVYQFYNDNSFDFLPTPAFADPDA